MQPNIVLAESLELIEIEKRGEANIKLINQINHIVCEINPQILVLHGVGIKCGQDVNNIIIARVQAAGSTSGIILSKDLLAMVEEMIKTVRIAWNDIHNE
jgi:triosephosphate isomerase